MGWETINGGKVLADKKIQSSQQWAIAFQIHTPPPPHPTKTTGPQPGGGLGKSDISCFSPVACGLK